MGALFFKDKLDFIIFDILYYIITYIIDVLNYDVQGYLCIKTKMPLIFYNCLYNF